MLEKLGVDSNSIRPWPNIVLDDPYLVRLDPSKRRRRGSGTGAQTAPDYILNPLSIFRMARHDIPEGHAPEGTVSPSSGGDLQVPTTGSSSTHEKPRTGATGDGVRNANLSNAADEFNLTNSIYGSVEGVAPSLDMFFTPDLAWDWQPAETVVGSGLEVEGLLPWVGRSQFSSSAFMPGQ